MLLEWLSRDHVKQWWDDGDITLEKVAQYYGELEEGLERCLLIMSDESGERPIGYFQHYPVADGSIGIDQFICEEDL